MLQEGSTDSSANRNCSLTKQKDVIEGFYNAQLLSIKKTKAKVITTANQKKGKNL